MNIEKCNIDDFGFIINYPKKFDVQAGLLKDEIDLNIIPKKN